MRFEIFKAFPPDRDTAVAELHSPHGDGVDVPMQVYRAGDELRIAIFSIDGRVAWEYPVEELMTAIRSAIESLGG
ncbi:MAG TPA: hypothetical protein VK662_08390 [Acidothermaceae bacterium]|nr:hypothetical protein [Acidothermaceae bacterium]